MQGCQSNEIPHPKPFTLLWPTIARADVIGHGILKKIVERKRSQYDVSLIIRLEEVASLKTERLPTPLFAYVGIYKFAKNIVSEEELQKLLGKRVVVLAVGNPILKYDVPTLPAVPTRQQPVPLPLKPPEVRLGLLGIKPVIADTLLSDVANEIKNQEQVVAKWPGLRISRSDSSDDSVRRQIEQLLNRTTKVIAFHTLIRMGKSAIPALVRHMEDFRPLPEGHIRVENPPEHFEEYATYSPKVVLDIISIILAEIANVSFGFVYNGGSNTDRRNVLNAWRLYAFYEFP